MHIYGIQKNGTEDYLQGSNGETDIENRLMDMGNGEERVTCMKRVTWTFTLPYVKQIANENLLYVSGISNRGSVSTYCGGMGREIGRREVQMGGNICIPMADSC